MPNKLETLTRAALALLPAAALAAPAAAGGRLRVARYALPTEKLGGRVRLALLSDLHSCYYGPRQGQITEALARQRPDAVLLAGDIADDRRPHANAFALLRQLGRQYPSFYVSGNHEVWSGELPWLKERFAAYGVTVLAGGCRRLFLRGQRLSLFGVDDPSIGRRRQARQSIAAARQMRPEEFNLLLAHRPEFAPCYAALGYDLILAGHTHGGQWRLPGLCNGVYASGQGLFPKYAGGEYRLGATALIIGRGLARESTPVPRVFNRPELVLVDLVPKSG